jgi:mono/diheme cytochrome c family protein
MNLMLSKNFDFGSFFRLTAGLAMFAAIMAGPAAAADVASNFKEHCASCHGSDRLGGLGPALLPENLGRLRKADAEKVIRDGRPATQMLGVGQKLSAEEIKALVDYVTRRLSQGRRGARRKSARRALSISPRALCRTSRNLPLTR